MTSAHLFPNVFNPYNALMKLGCILQVPQSLGPQLYSAFCQ